MNKQTADPKVGAVLDLAQRIIDSGIILPPFDYRDVEFKVYKTKGAREMYNEYMLDVHLEMGQHVTFILPDETALNTQFISHMKITSKGVEARSRYSRGRLITGDDAELLKRLKLKPGIVEQS